MMAAALPSNVAVLLPRSIADEIADAARRRATRGYDQEARTRATADVVAALQHLADRHVACCPCSYAGHHECRGLRHLKREIHKAEGRYRRELKRLRGGK
jgi:hypothetical protein